MLGQVSFVQSMHVLLASQMGQLPLAVTLLQSGSYVDILDICHNEFIIRVSPVLSNMVLVSSCNEGKVNGAQGKNS